MGMKNIGLAALALLSLAGCSTQQYWARPATDLKTTATDLEACRLGANAGGQKVFSAAELEQPCMVAKGYQLSDAPPQE
ncbi:MAG: hypothetical protein ACREHF_12425 [Rhizomicrobium sp.]